MVFGKVNILRDTGSICRWRSSANLFLPSSKCSIRVWTRSRRSLCDVSLAASGHADRLGQAQGDVGDPFVVVGHGRIDQVQGFA